jgi:prophage antirepressor-like protein
MNELMVKTFGDKQVRANIDEYGDLWFVSQDVMEILDIRNQAHALRKLDDSERGEVKLQGEGGFRTFAAVSESGLYALIMQSKKKNAKDFRLWVTKEVLPSIRKTGSYSTKDMDPLDILENHLRKMRALQRANESVVAKLNEVEIMARQDDDTLTHDQISEMDREISERIKILGKKEYAGYIKKKLKNRFFSIPGTRTYKELPRRAFSEAIGIIRNFTP